MKKVAIVSIQGVPACYGGFETLVENLLGDNCSANIEYTIYCSSKDMRTHYKEYKGAKLEYVNWKANGSQGIIYDSISLIKARNSDVILLLGGGIPFFSFFRWICKGKIIYNVDGISHTRDKYGKFAKWYLYTTKKNMINHSDILISDNVGIQDYVKRVFNRDSYMIAYGGDHAILDMPFDKQKKIVESYGFEINNYAISVCRVEPENNCHITLEAFSKSKENLIFIGNWGKSEYGRNLKEKYSHYKNIIVHDPVYDILDLFALRNNAKMYIHGHSVGGTNPSLVEAMFFGKPIIAFDVIFNRKSTGDLATYFKNEKELEEKLGEYVSGGEELLAYAWKHYTWKHIANQYEELY